MKLVGHVGHELTWIDSELCRTISDSAAVFKSHDESCSLRWFKAYLELHQTPNPQMALVLAEVAAAMLRHGYPLNAEAKRTSPAEQPSCVLGQWTCCMVEMRFLCQDYQPVKTPRLTLMHESWCTWFFARRWSSFPALRKMACAVASTNCTSVIICVHLTDKQMMDVYPPTAWRRKWILFALRLSQDCAAIPRMLTRFFTMEIWHSIIW